jgi:hypothetical protein
MANHELAVLTSRELFLQAHTKQQKCQPDQGLRGETETTKVQLKRGPAHFREKSEEKFDSRPGGSRQHFDGKFCRDFRGEAGTGFAHMTPVFRKKE